MNFNYEIINEEFENDKAWIVILKFSTLTTLKIMVEFDSNSNLKIFDESHNKFELILNFQIKHYFQTWQVNFKSIYPNVIITLVTIQIYTFLKLKPTLPL